jgi:hypothetical protein
VNSNIFPVLPSNLAETGNGAGLTQTVRYPVRKYRKNAATAVRVDFGIGLCAGLGLFKETADLAPDFEALNEELDQASDKRRAARKALVKARAALRFANYQTDQVIRAGSKAAEIADGGRRGPVFHAAFPLGLRPVVAPTGTRQVPATEKLVERISKSKVAGMSDYATAWLPKLNAALGGMKAAADAYGAAYKAYLDVFGSELALREEHLLAVDRLAGQVRAAFPGDRERQDLIFPVVESDDTAEAEEADAPDAGNDQPQPS